MKSKSLTYKQAGVDIAKAERFVRQITRLAAKREKFAKTTKSPQDEAEANGFGSNFDFFKLNFKRPVLVSSTDGVGTKLKIAFLVNKHDTIGVDLVAMNVNDILTTGARPLFFLDYLATSKINNKILNEVIKGIIRGCQMANCSLIGGELAELPGFYKKGEYDLAGFCVGVVEKDKMLNPKYVKEGDVIVGIVSSGLHSNGFSLVRKVFTKSEQRKMAPELLKPTRIYIKPIISLLNKVNSKSRRAIKAMAHVTGGAFYQKIPKVLPKGKAIHIYKNTWSIPKIFKLIQEKGQIEEKEMFGTFNMGIGFVLVVDRKKTKKIMEHLIRFNLKSWVIGEVIKGDRKITIL
jgi:phosphoribosylformylglycinamidine cyclo-ligase